MIFHPRRAVCITLARDQPALFEPIEPVGEDVAGNPLGRILEIREAPLVVQQEIPNHQQRPAIADEIECASNRAG
jgi:hypothetical protein